MATPGAVAGQTYAVLDSQPILEFGTAENLYHVEDILQLDDRIVIADRGSNSVLVYDAVSGDLALKLGRDGEGPGEYQWLGSVDECGDGFITWDPLQDRVTVYREWEVASTFRVQMVTDSRVPQVVSCSGDHLIGQYRSGELWPEHGPFRQPFQVRSVDEDGRPSQMLVEVPGDERYRTATNEGPRVLGLRSFIVPTGDGGFISGTGDTYDATLYSSNGVQLGTLSIDAQRIRITDAEIDQLNARELALYERHFGRGTAGELRRNQEEYDYPDRYPGYRRGFVDDDARAWLERYPPVGAEGVTWDVFDLGTRRHLGSVAVLAAFEAHSSRSSLLAGVWTDEFDVETIRIYRLRPEGARVPL